jgi:hypothetical protein
MTRRRALETPQIAMLRLEGVALFAFGVALFASTGVSWWLFAILLLSPDLSALGYLAGPRIGALCYNLAHTYTLPAALIGVGWATGTPPALAFGSIWLCHIGMDRVVGYGLKHRTAFRSTHLSF